jgi:hypothetical protein
MRRRLLAFLSAIGIVAVLALAQPGGSGNHVSLAHIITPRARRSLFLPSLAAASRMAHLDASEIF